MTIVDHVKKNRGLDSQASKVKFFFYSFSPHFFFLVLLCLFTLAFNFSFKFCFVWWGRLQVKRVDGKMGRIGMYDVKTKKNQ